MEALIHLTCNEGDTVLIPSPLYYSFAGDWWVRCQARIGTVYTGEETGYEPNVAALEKAYQEAVSNGSRVKVLALN